MPVMISGTIWGAMNLACVLFFSYAPLLMVAQGSSPTVAASLTSLAIWFTILAIPAGGYLVHRSGRPITAIVACSLIAAAALMLFVVDFHSDDRLPDFRRRDRSDVGRDPVAAGKGARAGRPVGGLWPVLYLLLRPDGGRTHRRRAPAGRLGIAVGGAGRQRRAAGIDGAAGRCCSGRVEAPRIRASRAPKQNCARP